MPFSISLYFEKRHLYATWRIYIKRYQQASYLLRTLKTVSFGKNDPQNMNMEKKFNYIKKSLTHYTSFEILHEKIEPEKNFFFLAGIPIPRVQFLRFLTK